MASPRSVRFDDDVLRRLDGYLRSHPGSSTSSVANQFVDEALRMDEHPGITFRPGPAGRRAGLVGGPDVWEVIGALQASREAEEELADETLVSATAEATGQPEHRVRIAVRYYAAYRDEIDEWITANQAAADAAEALWLAEQEVLRAPRRPA